MWLKPFLCNKQKPFNGVPLKRFIIAPNWQKAPNILHTYPDFSHKSLVKQFYDFSRFFWNQSHNWLHKAISRDAILISFWDTPLQFFDSHSRFKKFKPSLYKVVVKDYRFSLNFFSLHTQFLLVKQYSSRSHT